VLKVTSIVIASVLAASAAWAEAPARYVATLAKPVAAKTDIIVDSNIWQCEGTACTLSSKQTGGGSVSTCHRLWRKVGDIAAYGNGTTVFDADQLKVCNEK